MVRRDGKGFPDQWTSTTHLLGQHHIEVDGDTAKSEVYFESTARMLDPDGTEWRLVNSGRYLDQWERRDNVFRIIKRTVVYDGEVHTEPVRTNWPGPDHKVPMVAWGGPEIPSAGTVWGTGSPPVVRTIPATSCSSPSAAPNTNTGIGINFRFAQKPAVPLRR
jgi:hypothetical protein